MDMLLIGSVAVPVPPNACATTVPDPRACVKTPVPPVTRQIPWSTPVVVQLTPSVVKDIGRSGARTTVLWSGKAASVSGASSAGTPLVLAGSDG